MSITIRGRYTPRHPEKYVGDVTRIVYRSSWEKSFNQFLDNNPNVLQWASEEIGIPYIKPGSKRANKTHTYYPDYWVKYKNKKGEIIQEIIEIKPISQTKPPTTVGKNKRQQLIEAYTYAVNIAKWKACTDFCNKYDMKFRIVTENSLFR